MKLLLIEDESQLRQAILAYFHQEGFLVEAVADFPAAQERIADYDYDCVLVDILLPKGSGLDLVKQIKQVQPQTGIIIISAKDSFDDKIMGLDLGADDYLAKPFYLPELNARIRALIRRKHHEGNLRITINELSILPAERRVFVNDKDIELTGKGFDLLLFLLSNKDRVIARNAIAEHLWGDHADRFDQYDFLYSQIKNLRKKLTEEGCRDYLQTIYGIGYKFNTKA